MLKKLTVFLFVIALVIPAASFATAQGESLIYTHVGSQRSRQYDRDLSAAGRAI